MSFDNRVFDVNGHSLNNLKEALMLAFKIARSIHGNEERTTKAWKVVDKKGLVLYWHEVNESNSFISPLDSSAVVGQVWRWLQDNRPEDYNPESETNANLFDGSTIKGWRVYTEEHGVYGEKFYSLAVIKPIYLWIGK